MKYKIAFIAAILAALFIGFGIASHEYSISDMNKNFKHWSQLAELDRSFLKTIDSRPSSLITGNYVFEVSFPEKPPTKEILELTFVDGKFDLPKPNEPKRNGMAETIVQNGNVVSWHYEGIMYESNAECVGLIDGNVIWGRIYGWNPGDESIGVWKIYPKPNE